MKHYPSWRYHKNGDSKVIKSEAEDLALDDGWKHSPADHAEVEESPGDKDGESLEAPKAKKGKKDKS